MNLIQVGEYKLINIGERILVLREERKLSARKLANMANLDPSQISKIEQGVSKPSLDALDRICNAFGISMSDFFSKDSFDIPSYQRELLQTSKSLSAHQIELLNNFLKSLNLSNDTDK